MLFDFDFVIKIYTTKHVSGVSINSINDIPTNTRFVIVKQRRLLEMCALSKFLISSTKQENRSNGIFYESLCFNFRCVLIHFFEFVHFCIIYRTMVYVNQRHLYFNAEDLVEKLVDIFTMLRN